MYADYEYYAEVYGGTMPQEEAEKALTRASDDLNALCFGRIDARGLERLTAFQQGKIRRACCLQADFLHDNADALDSSLESYAINGVSMTFGNPSLYSVVGGTPVRNSALALLRQTGLASGCVYPCEVRP